MPVTSGTLVNGVLLTASSKEEVMSTDWLLLGLIAGFVSYLGTLVFGG
jgi:hypothetical protein